VHTVIIIVNTVCKMDDMNLGGADNLVSCSVVNCLGYSVLFLFLLL